MPDMLEKNIKTSYIAQDMFPGAFIEPKWSLPDSMTQAPFYAMMLVLGCTPTTGIGPNNDYVSMSFEGTEYVLHESNYQLCKQLHSLFISSYLTPKGYVVNPQQFRFMPGLIIDGLRELHTLASNQLQVDQDKTKMLWILPDEGPCGAYRSRMPAAYMHTVHKDTYYAENSDIANTNVIPWFDVLIMHRIATKKLFAAFQQATTQRNKIIVNEYDDDFFSIPEWNHNSKKIGVNELQRFVKQLDLSDVIICSTQHLVDISIKPENSYHGPNLIDIETFGEKLQCNREYSDKYSGYRIDWDRNAKKIYYKHDKKPRLNSLDSDYNPIRILWAGSNTHDKDLETIIPCIKKLGVDHGIAIALIFFGYIPQEFVEVITDSGNTKGRLQVKDQYSHYVHYIEPVPYGSYIHSLREIDADFALCPLYSDPFNLGKSNLKVLEMGALGMPCVVSNFGPYEFIEHRKNGMKCSNHAEWISNITELAINKSIRLELSNNIYNDVVNNYSWNVDSQNRQKWDLIFDVIRKKSQERILSCKT